MFSICISVIQCLKKTLNGLWVESSLFGLRIFRQANDWYVAYSYYTDISAE